MNELLLFNALEKLKKSELLELLNAAYKALESDHQEIIFSKYATRDSKEPTTHNKVSPDKLVTQIKTFQEASLAGDYYAPFMIDSKNFMDVPEETEEWFDKLSTYFEQCCVLSKNRQDKQAIISFEILFSLLDEMCDEEIVFADQLGNWMLPGDDEQFNLCYVQSAARVCQPQQFAQLMLPVLREDSYSSYCNKVYKKINEYSSKEQISAVKKAAKKESVELK